MARVLIVDDEQNMRWVLQEAMNRAGHTSHSVASGAEALSLLSRTPIDLLVLDLKLKGMDGLSVLREVHTRWPNVVVIILTAYGTVATAVEALQNGAADYLRKPFDVEELVFKITRSLERQALQQEVTQLREKPVVRLPGSHVVWRRAVEAACNALANGFDVLLQGEMGCGKATIARYAHAVSPRRAARLVDIDVSTLPAAQQPYVLEDTAEKGGFWSLAGQGVLLLRHVEALSEGGHGVIVRLREQRTLSGVGPLLMMTACSHATSDAFAATIAVPPLREHSDDIPLLVAEWIGTHPITTDAQGILYAYAWPGNVAELRGVVEHAAALAKDAPIAVGHLPVSLQQTPTSGQPFVLPPDGMHLEEVEASLLRQALEVAGGNKTRAAELLGLSRQTFLYRIEKYRIT